MIRSHAVLLTKGRSECVAHECGQVSLLTSSPAPPVPGETLGEPAKETAGFTEYRLPPRVTASYSLRQRRKKKEPSSHISWFFQKNNEK